VEKICRRNFVIIKKSKLSEFFTHLNTIESFIQFTTKQENEECFLFLDLLTKCSSNGHLLSAVYRKPTHLDRYLNFRSEHPIQQEQSVVNILLERAKELFSTAQDLNSGMKYVKRTLVLNCYPKWMIQNKKNKQHNGFSEFISKVILPCTTDLGESLKRILEKHRKRTVFKPTIKPSTILSSGKDTVSTSKCRGVVCEIPCVECEQKYDGQTSGVCRKLSCEVFIQVFIQGTGTLDLEKFSKIQKKQL